MIGIIGGSGFYSAEMLKGAKKVKVKTPYGETSSKVAVGEFRGKKVCFIPRHGKTHSINPTNVNYRANIHAMKELGVTHILAPTAVGSLNEGIKPGDLVFTDQFIDRTTKRKSTFYEGKKVCHIGMAEPFCPSLKKLLAQEAKKLGYRFHSKGTAVVVEGPRFSTKAESNLYRDWKADLINMTMVPECVLAREKEICYANIATITDYDCWKEYSVTVEEIIGVTKKTTRRVEKLIEAVIPRINEKERECGCGNALEGALI